MTLATHIAIAGALGAPFVGAVPPVALFEFALGSHYLADTVPHYDYKLRYAFNEGPNPPRFNLLDFLIHDCGRVGFDIALGATLAVAALGLENFLAHPLPLFLLGLGSILPDLLSALHAGFPSRFLQWNQDFQDFMHSKKLRWSASAVISQLLILAGALALVRFF